MSGVGHGHEYSQSVPTRYELVIFDCDGVLVDSERIAVRVDALVLEAMGWPLSEAEIIERFVGRTHEHMTQQLSEHLGRPLPADWDSGFAHLYREAIESELEAVPGVVAALDQITIPTCVASSGTQAKMHITLARCGLMERFRGRIFSATEVANGKPAPDLFLHAAASLSVEPHRCAVVEDSSWGVQAALAAGMDAYAYAGGVTPVARLRGDGVVVFGDMAQLPTLLGAGL